MRSRYSSIQLQLPGTPSVNRFCVFHSLFWSASFALAISSMPAYPQSIFLQNYKQRLEPVHITPGQANIRFSGLQPALKHYPPNSLYKLKTPLGQGWRLNYDLLLTGDGHTRTIFDEHGRSHIFHAATKNMSSQKLHAEEFIPENNNSGSLSIDSSRYRWSRPDGSVIEFQGSLPLKWIMQDGNILFLHYAAGRLLSVSDSSGAILSFNYNNNKLTSVTLPDRTHLRYRFNDSNKLMLSVDADHAKSLPLQANNNNSNLQFRSVGCRESVEDTFCDTEIHPPPDDFMTAASVPGTIRIDARPQSCGSYFTDFSSIDRGVLIENHFSFSDVFSTMEATVRSFPIVDFIDESQIHIAHSRDLTSDTYSPGNENPLYDSLIQDGAEIVSVFLDPLQDAGFLSVNELGENTTIRLDQFDTVVLNLVIRFDIASPHQIVQIQQARQDLLEQYGIYLRVIEIP